MVHLVCPRCRSDLDRRTIAEPEFRLVIDACPTCEGLWFDRGQLDLLEHIVEPAFMELRNIPSPGEQMEPLTCPVCSPDREMIKGPHFRDAKVIMDRCPDCGGIWLDGGELKAIQEEHWLITLGRALKFLSGSP